MTKEQLMRCQSFPVSYKSGNWRYCVFRVVTICGEFRTNSREEAMFFFENDLASLWVLENKKVIAIRE